MDVYVYERPLPGFCNEMVGQTEDATVIVVNSDLADAQKMAALEHAMRHLERGHFDGNLTADEAEADAHTANAVFSPDLGPRTRFSVTDEEIPVLRVKSAKWGK